MSSKNIKKRVYILMCATLLSTSALPVTSVFADDVSSVIEKTTSDKPANGVSDQAQQNESAISSTKIEETTMSSTATVSKENSHLEVQKKSSSSESSAPATSVIATDEAVQPTNIITDMWGTAPVSYNKVNGELTVSSGTISGGNIGNSSIKKQDVTKIIISGDVKLPSTSANLFSGSYFPNLVVIEGSFDTSNVTDMDHMFANSELTSLDLTNWDTSNVTDMSYMFAQSKLTSLDVSQWNTSNVTNMRHMFHSINMEHLDVDNWDTSNVTDMDNLFEFAPISSINVSKWNTSNVTNMATAFFKTNLTELDLTNWDTSKVQNSSSMFVFSGIKKLTLGSKTKFNNDPNLPDIDQSSGVYTGRWERIDPVSPQSFYNGSNDFMSNYDGSFPGTYVWEKTKVKAADVTAKYLDESGKTISDNVILSGNIGEDYNTTQKDLPGYTFKAVQGNPTGQFTSDAQIVTYIYTKDPVAGANVTAKYVDENGKTISDDVVKNGNVGDSYTTEQKAIPGYTFKEIQGSASGQFTDKEQTVTYVYTKDPVVGGSVLVKYVDEAGNTLSDNVVKSGNIGDDYSTEQKAIPGYTFKEVQGSASGQFTDQEQTITYVYTKNSVTPVKPTEPGTTQTNENNTETPVKNTTNVSLHNNVSTLGSVSTTNEKSLPTTGEKPANWAVVVGGLITLTAATVLYLLKRKY